jgi:DNA-binding transcriptional MerR regulator
MKKQPTPAKSKAKAPANSTGTVYTIETVERITRISRDRIVFYYQHGLVSTIHAPDKTDLLFDDQAIHRLRRIAFLLSEYGINHDGLKMVTALMDEVERLREKVRFLRER